MAAGCTGASPGASKAPKIPDSCCSRFLGLEMPEEQQGDYSCTVKEIRGWRYHTEPEEDFPFP